MKILKWLGFIILGIFAIIFIIGLSLHRPIPKATAGLAADNLAKEMLTALNQSAWDSTRYVAWTFREHTHYLWDKQNNLVEVAWDDIKVLINTKSLTGKVYQEAVLTSGKQHDKLFEKAWASFCNDSFWLCAPFKVFDPGTSRGLVTKEDQSRAFIVTYESGGVTPGDRYLWTLNEKSIPVTCEMWVSIIPIGGVKSTWVDWQPLASGAMIARGRKLFDKLEIPITGIQSGQSLEQLGRAQDPFSEL